MEFGLKQNIEVGWCLKQENNTEKIEELKRFLKKLKSNSNPVKL